jgi:hypothetical protein
MHAHRNVSAEPAIDLIITAAKPGRFFEEIGRPVTGAPPAPPTPQDLARFTETAIRYGYTLGTRSRTRPPESSYLNSPGRSAASKLNSKSDSLY